MSDTATAMRDPIFYRWHCYINFMFEVHKATLPRYSLEQLNYDGIVIKELLVETPKCQPNALRTFWQQSDIDLSRGIDFIPRGPVYLRITHLQHRDFTYTIKVNNTGKPRMGTCRIFIAPKFDERGAEWIFRDQRTMFIALDRFTVYLISGENTIMRRSTDSTVTIPWEQTFRDLDSNSSANDDEIQQFNFCGCGWPHHMLLPKGTPEGFPCQLFVMVSNYADDHVYQEDNETCKNADNYCGIKNKLYPDRRSMGYPFDRIPRAGVTTLKDFLTLNMGVQNVQVTFEEEIKLQAKTNVV